MINVISSKKLSISKVVVSEDLTLPVRRLLLTYPPMMQDADNLSVESIRTASVQAPPIVYENKRNLESGDYWCIGNIRTVFLAKRLEGRERVRCVVVEPPNVTDVDQMALTLLLAEKSCLMLDPDSVDDFLLDIYTTLKDNRGKRDITDISKSFSSKKAFLESFNINRRKQ